MVHHNQNDGIQFKIRQNYKCTMTNRYTLKTNWVQYSTLRKYVKIYHLTSLRREYDPIIPLIIALKILSNSMLENFSPAPFSLPNQNHQMSDFVKIEPYGKRGNQMGSPTFDS